MSRRKNKHVESAVLETADKASSRPGIPFSHWFDKKVKSGELKFYQDEALLVFFKKKGLKNVENEDAYNRELENF